MKSSIYGFSLIELLITIGIIGILAMVAVPSYLRYKEAPVKAAMKHEATELSKFLKYAYSVDGFYHPKIYTMGYRPSATMIASAGFDVKRYEPINALCNRIPPRGSDYSSFLTLTGDNMYRVIKVESATKGWMICRFSDSCTIHDEYNEENITAWGSKTFPHTESDSTCKTTFSGQNIKPSCDEYLLYSQAKFSETASNWATVYANHSGIFCYSDPKGDKIESF